MKTIYKATGIQGTKEIEIEIVNLNYNDEMVEARIVEGNFKGHMVVVSKCYINEYKVEEMHPMEEKLLSMLTNELGLQYDEISEQSYVVEGVDYNIYIDIHTELNEYSLCTENLNIDHKSKELEDPYYDYFCQYRNHVTRKSIKGIKNYIDRFYS